VFRQKREKPGSKNIMAAYGPGARRVIRASEDVARDLGHDVIEPDHILVAQHTLPDHRVARLLCDHGASLPDMTKELKLLRPKGAIAEGPIRFGPRGREVLTAAWAICHGSGASEVGPVHLALAVIRLPDTTARALLDQLGVVVDDLDTALRALLAPDSTSDGDPDLPPAPDAPPTPRSSDSGLR
jgi:ATP-dependent Clp protease ATP-binding subunit ClpA